MACEVIAAQLVQDVCTPLNITTFMFIWERLDGL
jgi:hypothetical protein